MPTPGPAGYSGKPVAMKLGIKAGCRLLLLGAPEGYDTLVGPLPAGVTRPARAAADVDLVHLFVTRKEQLVDALVGLRKSLRGDAAVWVSWPKRSSGVPSTVQEDTIREVALPLGFVDIKVCAIDATWSGLKLVLRKDLRPAATPGGGTGRGNQLHG